MTEYNNKRYQYLQPIFYALILIIGIYIGKQLYSGSLHQSHGSAESISQSNKITDIVSYIENNYVDSVSLKDLSKEAIVGMLESLDPHSSFIPIEDFNEANDPLQGKFEGIGIQFRIQKDTIMVLQTLAGGPSEKIGLKAGDRIVKVEGENVASIGITNKKVVKLLKGERGTKVHVSIFRKGHSSLIEFDIIRDVVPTHSVDIAYMVTDKIGYIKINKFAANTYDEFHHSLTELEASGMEELMLDFRGNSGGYLKAAIDISDEFLKDNELIVFTKGLNRSASYAHATKKGDFQTGSLVVLIDDWSASASEIVAGAIQDNDRGQIVGRRSFGKGLVQEQMELPDGSALRLTVARYYTPTGRCIQESYQKGVQNYYNKFYDRVAKIEMPDTASIADSLKYTTPGGKTVYGGGGIFPDIYILPKKDTIYRYYNQLLNKGLIYQFAFDYVDKNRDNLKNYSTTKKYLDSFTISDELFSEFTAYAELKGVKENDQTINLLKTDIITELKALIGRNLIGDDAFYPLLHQIDHTFQAGLKAL